MLERKKRRMTTTSTIEDFASRTLLVMRYFFSSSERFFCHRSMADCILEWEGKGGREWKDLLLDSGQNHKFMSILEIQLDPFLPPLSLLPPHLTLISCLSCFCTSAALARRASLTARSSSETTGSRRAVRSQMAISRLSSAMCGGSLFLSRT